MRAVRVVITGRVQGVGYRAWTAGEAQLRGLAGWVRNRRDGSVEALFAGDEAVIQAMLAACREGPPAALIDRIETADAQVPQSHAFSVLPTA